MDAYKIRMHLWGQPVQCLTHTHTVGDQAACTPPLVKDVTLFKRDLFCESFSLVT